MMCAVRLASIEPVLQKRITPFPSSNLFTNSFTRLFPMIRPVEPDVRAESVVRRDDDTFAKKSGGELRICSRLMRSSSLPGRYWMVSLNFLRLYQSLLSLMSRKLMLSFLPLFLAWRERPAITACATS